MTATLAALARPHDMCRAEACHPFAMGTTEYRTQWITVETMLGDQGFEGSARSAETGKTRSLRPSPCRSI